MNRYSQYQPGRLVHYIYVDDSKIHELVMSKNVSQQCIRENPGLRGQCCLCPICTVLLSCDLSSTVSRTSSVNPLTHSWPPQAEMAHGCSGGHRGTLLGVPLMSFSGLSNTCGNKFGVHWGCWGDDDGCVSGHRVNL